MFLFLFQPLSIDDLETRDKYFLVIGLGVITFLSLSLNLLILHSHFPKILNGSSWNIKKENLGENRIPLHVLVQETHAILRPFDLATKINHVSEVFEDLVNAYNHELRLAQHRIKSMPAPRVMNRIAV